MVPDNVEEPSWVSRWRKFIVAGGGFIAEGIALWAGAPEWILAVGFVTAVLVGAIANEQPAEKPTEAPS